MSIKRSPIMPSRKQASLQRKFCSKGGAVVVGGEPVAPASIPTLPVGGPGVRPKRTKTECQKPITGLPDFATRRKRLSKGILPVSTVQQLDKALADCERISGGVSLPTDRALLREKIRRRLAAKRRDTWEKSVDAIIHQNRGDR
jgi:hypothetical protein